MNKIRRQGKRIGSDGLIYNEETDQVEYDKNRDGRSGGGIPPGTPPYNP